MANFIHFENSHVFSKAPVQENMTAAAAVNKSTHTVQAEEVWAKPIPFIKYKDIEDLTSDESINREGYATVKFYYKKEITILNANNNNGKDSNGLAAKVFIKNSPINQFISETDVTDPSGALAFGYKPILFDESGEPVASDKYTINCSNGIIYFTEPVTASDGKYYLSFFTYEDEKVGNFISSLQEHVNDNAIHITEALSTKWNENVDATNQNSELISGLTSNLDKHANDGTIHITEASSKKWNDNIDATNQNSVLLQQHVNDNAIHITEESSKKWDDNIEATNQNSALLQQHVNDGTIHITETSSKKWDDNIETTTQNSDLISGLAVILNATKDNLTDFINDVDSTLEEHVLDNDVHITDSERDAWNNNVTRTEENNNLITGITTIINSLNDTVDALDISLDEHISDTESHLSEADREKLNNLSGDVNGELIAGLATSIIEVENDLDSHTSDTIIHITQEDRDRWDNAGNTVVVDPISDIIWNLNDLLLSCIKDKDNNDNVDNGAWVKELLRANAQDNRKISEKLIGIVNYQDIYGTDSFEKATEMWIAEASNPNRKISTQLSFLYDSYVTNELFRLLFYKLDERLNNEYGASGSVSAKYMKPGLTIKYLAKVEDNIEVYPNEGYGKNRYKYITVRYRGKTSSENSISENHINWGHLPTIDCVINRPTNHPDTFRKAMAWDVIDSEEYDNSDIIKVNIEDLDERIAVIEGVTPFNTSNVQPSETTQWIAAEFKETESINNIINKKIRGISIKVANTVSSPQYLAIFDTRTSGTKKLLGVSKGTTWKASEIAEFNFNSSITIPSSFEVFLLDYPISTDLTGDPDKPTHYIESYTSSGNQSYRNLDGAWNSEKRSFYLTFNLVGDRMTAAEKNISSTYSSIKTLVPNEYSVDGAGRSGAFTTFILPNNFYPANVQFNAIKIDTLNINGTTPTEAYLGVMALYSDGTKKALGISDNTNLSGTKGSPVWYFSTPFTIEENYRLIFYILKDKESFIESEPTVDKNVAIGAVVYNTNVLDPYENWNEAQTNLNFGFIVNGPYQQNKAYSGWPACTLYKLNHVNNQDIHITDSERTKWNSALYTISEGDYIDISDDSNTISVTNIAESISDSNSNSLVTEGTLIKYADDTKDENGNITEEGLLTRWHIENEYFHMKKSVADSLKSFNLDNYGVGDECKGVIMNLPYLSKIKSISLVAVTASSYNQPIASKAMTWSNYRLKIVDILTGKVLATSKIGKNANTSLNTSEKGYPIGVFDFDKQIYCDANRDYYILFVNEADETANIELAYANGNGSYATYENYIFGQLSPSVILPDGNTKDHPKTFSVAGQTSVPCEGYACDFAVDTVKSEELTHLSEEIAELRRYFISMSTYLSQLSKLQ